MSKCVIYTDTPSRGEMPYRVYLQEAGSLGMTKPFWLDGEDHGKLNTLDSRCLIFPNAKEAITYAEIFANVHTRFGGCQTVGIHGITENGNACPPFKVVKHGNDEMGWTKEKHEAWQARVDAWNNMLIPALISRSEVEIPRLGDVTPSELLDRITYLTDNLVEEELDEVIGTLQNMDRLEFRCTDIDTYPESATIHYTRDHLPAIEPYHCSLTICSLNLFDEKGIQQLKDLAARETSDA
jgi:hypothetical protein